MFHIGIDAAGKEIYRSLHEASVHCNFDACDLETALDPAPGMTEVGGLFVDQQALPDMDLTHQTRMANTARWITALELVRQSPKRNEAISYSTRMER